MSEYLCEGQELRQALKSSEQHFGAVGEVGLVEDPADDGYGDRAHDDQRERDGPRDGESLSEREEAVGVVPLRADQQHRRRRRDRHQAERGDPPEGVLALLGHLSGGVDLELR